MDNSSYDNNMINLMIKLNKIRIVNGELIQGTFR